MRPTGRAASRLAILASTILLLVGCPLVSDYPLSDPKASSIDQSLIGKWKAENPDPKDQGIFTFLPFDEHELVGFTRGDEPGSTEAIRAFTTEVEGERFLNARELGKASPGWYLLRYRIEGSKLLMRLVDEGLFHGASISSSAQLLDFIRQNVANPKLYAPERDKAPYDMTWTREPN
jgi:hypothetical protein